MAMMLRQCAARQAYRPHLMRMMNMRMMNMSMRNMNMRTIRPHHRMHIDPSPSASSPAHGIQPVAVDGVNPTRYPIDFTYQKNIGWPLFSVSFSLHNKSFFDKRPVKRRSEKPPQYLQGNPCHYPQQNKSAPIAARVAPRFGCLFIGRKAQPYRVITPKR